MKERASKLDAYAQRLDELLRPASEGGQGLTLAQAQEQLRLDGCAVSTSRLSDWWAAREAARLQDRLLGQIASGARQCQEVEKELGKVGAPELDTLIKLHRVLILKLSTEVQADTELLELVNRMMKPVVAFARLKQLDAQLALDRDKFKRETCELFLKWSEDNRAKEIAASSGSNSDKIAKLGELMFGEDWQ